MNNQDQNVYGFDVKGIGHFVAYKEPPQKLPFQYERQELAKKIGGYQQLIEMETTIQQYRESDKPAERNLAFNIANELATIGTYIRMRIMIFDFPKDFQFETMSNQDYVDILQAWEKAQEPFRPATSIKEKEAAPANEAAVERKPDPEQTVPAGS